MSMGVSMGVFKNSAIIEGDSINLLSFKGIANLWPLTRIYLWQGININGQEYNKKY